jgi:hypothetical protein
VAAARSFGVHGSLTCAGSQCFTRDLPALHARGATALALELHLLGALGRLGLELTSLSTSHILDHVIARRLSKIWNRFVAIAQMYTSFNHSVILMTWQSFFVVAFRPRIFDWNIALEPSPCFLPRRLVASHLKTYQWHIFVQLAWARNHLLALLFVRHLHRRVAIEAAAMTTHKQVPTH